MVWEGVTAVKDILLHVSCRVFRLYVLYRSQTKDYYIHTKRLSQADVGHSVWYLALLLKHCLLLLTTAVDLGSLQQYGMCIHVTTRCFLPCWCSYINIHSEYVLRTWYNTLVLYLFLFYACSTPWLFLQHCWRHSSSGNEKRRPLWGKKKIVFGRKPNDKINEKRRLLEVKKIYLGGGN